MSSATSTETNGVRGVIAFEPRARLIKLIGGELVSDEIVAVTELVKNAYDADAGAVTITFKNILEPGGELIISDNGVGLDLDSLRNYWMQPGGTTKLPSGSRRSRKGRRMLGEKGIGRFAVDKLGTRLELSSRCRNEPNELHVEFDWTAFEHESHMLSAIGSRWELRSPEIVKGHGTTLRITGLRGRWTERLFRKLCSRLSRLKSPFQKADDFLIIIQSEEFPDYSGELSVDFLDRAPYRLEADFDGDQIIEVRPDKASPRQLNWNGAGALTCGPVRIRLFAYDLETPAIARIGPNREVRAWLKEWTGVSVYRDGFRVWPYGEPHDDWLRLDHWRVNNPTVRLSNNQVIGFVEISRDSNPDLIDQTNREGLIQNRAHEDLRRLAHFVLHQLEVERQSRRRPASDRKGGKSAATIEQESIADEVEALATHLTGKKAIAAKALARRIQENAERDRQQYAALASGYSELAAVGLAASGFSQAAEEILKSARSELDQLGDLLTAKGIRGATGKLRVLKALMSDLEGRTAILAPLESRHSMRRRAVDVAQLLAEVQVTFASVLTAHGVRLEIQTPEIPLRAEIRPENLHRLMHILLRNSLDWLDGVKSPRIRVTAQARDQQCVVVVDDNGPGIPTAIAEHVFEPMFTGRDGARGMGLTIARNIVEDAAGTIRVLVDGRRKGANIEFVLPRKGGRALRRRA